MEKRNLLSINKCLSLISLVLSLIAIGINISTFIFVHSKDTVYVGIAIPDEFTNISVNEYSLKNSKEVLHEIRRSTSTDISVTYVIDGYVEIPFSPETEGVSYGSKKVFVSFKFDSWREPELLKKSSDYFVFSVKSAANSDEREEIAVKVNDDPENSMPYDKLNVFKKLKMRDIYAKG